MPVQMASTNSVSSHEASPSRCVSHSSFQRNGIVRQSKASELGEETAAVQRITKLICCGPEASKMHITKETVLHTVMRF